MIMIRQALALVHSSGAAWFIGPSLYVEPHAIDQAIHAH
jgi:hypothetical protein